MVGGSGLRQHALRGGRRGDPRAAALAGGAEPGVDVDERDEQWEAAIDDEVGDRRAGRLVAGDEGRTDGVEQDVVGVDVGIDGAAASAEEAAMHVIDDTEDENTF